jgi:hypothetical protein
MKSIAVISTFGLMAALVPCCYGQQFTTLYTITNAVPAGLTRGKGVLYGATRGGGALGPGACGTVFELHPPPSGGGTWTPSVLYSFAVGGTDACQPIAGPVVGMGGLYGITSNGGIYPPPDFGALYELQPPASPGGAWTESVLYSFGAPGTQLGHPGSGLIAGPGGSYYVLGQDGGAEGAGAVDWLQPPASPGGTWTVTAVYSFPSSSVPPNSLVAGPNGVLYGTTPASPGGLGVVFQLTPPASPGGAWTNTVLHSFALASPYVGNPIVLTVAPDGTIYGTAYGADPPAGSGTSAAFQLTPPAAPGGQWGYAVLTTPQYYSKEHLNTPLALLNGNLYGGLTTGTGGSVFELTPPAAAGGAWTMTTLYTFTNGQVPIGNLIAAKGAVFGTAAAYPAGEPAVGTVYAIITK